MGFCRLKGTALVLRLVRREHGHEELGPAPHARAEEIVLFRIALGVFIGLGVGEVMVMMDAPRPEANA